jgi:hypothetical protein
MRMTQRRWHTLVNATGWMLVISVLLSILAAVHG